MGKYMKKAKPKGDLALLDSTTTTSYFGVRTRAKTLALQKSMSPPPELSSAAAATAGSYLQLRSRRLQKPPVSVRSHGFSSSPSKRPRHHQNPKSPISNPRSSPGLGISSEADQKEEEEVKVIVHENVDGGGAGVDEASFGENVLDFEGRERSTRESTPCSLIRDPDTVRTPGSTTRPTCSTEAHRRTENAARRQIPTAREMDEFFGGIEQAQQKQFMEKYNFDPVNEKPLPGRYEWEKLDSKKACASVPTRSL